MELNNDIPKFLKLIMMFIDRVGFPALAFCLMFYLSFVSIQKVTSAVADNTKALVSFSAHSDEIQKIIVGNQGSIMTDLRQIMLNKK
jgi:hypothetical protein